MATHNDTTTNYALELPHPDNHMSEDCQRIRNALVKLDAELKKKVDSNDVLPIAKGGTGANSAAAACANIGALPLGGGTLTGNILYKSPNIDIEITPASQLFNWNIFRDKNNVLLGAVGIVQKTDGRTEAIFKGCNKTTSGNAIESVLSLVSNKDGTSYATSPAPHESSYANDVDTLRASVNRHPIKLTSSKTFYVGGANASDTADLFMGRGESADKPFATLQAAVDWVRSNYSGPVIVYITLQADFSVNELLIDCAILRRLCLRSDSTKRKLTITKRIYCLGGSLVLENIILNGSGASSLITADGHSNYCSVRFNQGVELTGSVTTDVLLAQNNSFITVANDLTGNVTGRRYRAIYGSKFITYGRGVNAIPGSVAGACDGSSIYF